MNDLDTRARTLLDFYESHGRPLLEECGLPSATEVTAAAEMLRKALAVTPMVHVGFLGESQVGKSTLINALVGQKVLPSSGIGPLTAQATRLLHATNPYFRVTYHRRTRLNEFRFALERYLSWLGVLDAPPEEPPPTDGESSYAYMDFSAEAAAPGAATSDESERKQRGELLVAQARAMLRLDASVPLPVVHRLVRAVASKEEPHRELPPEAGPDAAARVSAIRQLLDSSEERTQEELGRKAFIHELKDRATGWRSPLISHLEVGLDDPLLAHAKLVDLPGIGVVGDPAGRVAEEFVRKTADALVVVVRNNGISEAIAELLEHTGVVERLLWAQHAERQPVRVIYAVTRLDDVARDSWRTAAVEARDRGEVPPSKSAFFDAKAEEMAEKIRQQLLTTLLASRQFDDLSPEQRAQRQEVVEQLVRSVGIVCVSAPDYLGLLQGLDDDCFLRDREATRIPLLRRQIAELADSAREHRERRIQQALDAFIATFSVTLEIHERARRDRKHARTEADERFREALAAVAEPLRKEAQANRRAFLSFVGQTMSERLGDLSDEASVRARKRLERLKREGATTSWSTLNAALTRNGTFKGARAIDYPGDLTNAFVEVIAGSWQAVVVEEVRKQLKKLAEADAALVDTLSQQAAALLETDELNVTLGELRRQIREQGKVSLEWTQQNLEELTEDVRLKLRDVVLAPIERACRAAQQAGRNRGQGARDRILETFDEGGQRAIVNAREACVAVLDEHVRRLKSSLGRVMRENYDPVSHVFDTIVETQAEEIARLGDLRRREQLARIQAVRRKLESQLLVGPRRVEDEPEPSPGSADVPATSSATEDTATPGAVAQGSVVTEGMNERAAGASLFDDL